MGIFNSIRDLLCPRFVIKYRDPKTGTIGEVDDTAPTVTKDEEGHLESKNYVLMDVFEFSLVRGDGAAFNVAAGLVYGKNSNSREFVSLIQMRPSTEPVLVDPIRILSLAESGHVMSARSNEVLSDGVISIAYRVYSDDAFIGSPLRNAIRAAADADSNRIAFFVWYHIVTTLHDDDGRKGLISVYGEKFSKMELALTHSSDSGTLFHIGFVDPVAETCVDGWSIDLTRYALELIPGRIMTPVGLMSASVMTISETGPFWCLTPDHHVPELEALVKLDSALFHPPGCIDDGFAEMVAWTFVQNVPEYWFDKDVATGGIWKSDRLYLGPIESEGPDVWVVGLMSLTHSTERGTAYALALARHNPDKPDYLTVIASTIEPFDTFVKKVRGRMPNVAPEVSDENGVANVIVYGSTISTVTPEIGAAIGKRAWEITELVDKVLRSLVTDGNLIGVVDRLGITQYLLRSMKQCLQYSVYLPSLSALDALYKEIDELHTKLNSIASLVNPR